jgi:hypothetical protein
MASRFPGASAVVVRPITFLLVSVTLVAGCGESGSSSASNAKAERDAQDQARGYEEHPPTNAVAIQVAVHTPAVGSTAMQAPRAVPIISCGSLVTASVYEISARRISCFRARRIVRQWLAQCEQAGRDPCLTTSRFYCRTLDASYRYNHIGCVYQLDLYKQLVSQRMVRFRIEGG